jgi:hypothetical protein
MDDRWNDTGKEKPKYSEKIQSQWHFVQHMFKTNVLKLNSGHGSDRPEPQHGRERLVLRKNILKY